MTQFEVPDGQQKLTQFFFLKIAAHSGGLDIKMAPYVILKWSLTNLASIFTKYGLFTTKSRFGKRTNILTNPMC